MSPDPRLQGVHKGCGGQVCDGSCQGCGADFMDPKHISKAAGARRPQAPSPKKTSRAKADKG